MTRPSECAIAPRERVVVAGREKSMNRMLVTAAIALAAVAGAIVGTHSARVRADATPAPVAAPIGAALLPGLGHYPFKITTTQPEAQRWFNQALMLTYGFNHDAAERSYLKAAQIDPECAMCWWGAALVLGPHVNATMDPADNPKAWQSLQRAVALAPKASAREREFIHALEARYAANPPDDRRPLDEAYAKATGALVAARPDDLDAKVFRAEALMDLQPWDYYDEKLQPKGNTAEVVSLLETVMKQDPNHAGALHLYVHAVEASANPERGVVAADKLRTLIPGSGHLVHMPAHIYSRVGRWHDAVIANQVAIAADNDYLATCGRNAKGVYPLGYVPHNPHFLWFAASMEGASKVAQDAARKTAQRVNLPDLMRQPGFAGLQHYWMTPWFDNVRFGRWDEIRAAPNPAPDLPYVTAIWNYAQAMAAVRQDRMDDANRHYAELSKLAADPVMTTLTVWDRYPLAHAANIAERTVYAELALARGDQVAAIAAFTEAVAIEDRIPYDEPPGWHSPVRQSLGAVLLAAGRPSDAERVYREELQRNPQNGWSLKGLALALRQQQRNDEAAAVEKQFQAAWQHSDVALVASRF
jgi:tetratricopeptide (TPR) repeat protein